MQDRSCGILFRLGQHRLRTAQAVLHSALAIADAIAHATGWRLYRLLRLLIIIVNV
jgi:hypothetical protein